MESCHRQHPHTLISPEGDPSIVPSHPQLQAAGGGITIAFQMSRSCSCSARRSSLRACSIRPITVSVVMVLAVVGVGEIFRDFGLSMAALQAKSLSQEQHSNLFWINTVVGLSLGIITFAASYPLAAFYGQSDVVVIAQTLSLTFVFGRSLDAVQGADQPGSPVFFARGGRTCSRTDSACSARS